MPRNQQKQRCTSQSKRTGLRCGHWANQGYAVCWLHGAGRQSRPGGRPITTGRYADLQHRRLAPIIEAFRHDPEPLNLYPELALHRALLQDFIERYDAFSTALLAWHASFSRALPQVDDEGNILPPVEKPRQILDIADASRIIDRIGSLVERIDTMERGPLVTQRDMIALVRLMRGVVERRVQDPATRQAIEEDWRALDPN